MNTQINQGFLFLTQYWTIEFQEKIVELQKESYFIEENDKEGVKKIIQVLMVITPKI